MTFSAAAGAVVAWVPAGAAAGAAQAATAAMIITSTATIMSSMGDCLSHFYLQNRLKNCASKDAGGLVVGRDVGESGETDLGMASQCLAVRVQRIVGIRRRIWGSPPVCISVDSLRFSNYTMKVYSVALELSKRHRDSFRPPPPHSLSATGNHPGGIRRDIPLPLAQIALQRRKEPSLEIQPRKRRSKQRL